jgi:hypothetical protein
MHTSVKKKREYESDEEYEDKPTEERPHKKLKPAARSSSPKATSAKKWSATNTNELKVSYLTAKGVLGHITTAMLSKKLAGLPTEENTLKEAIRNKIKTAGFQKWIQEDGTIN